MAASTVLRSPFNPIPVWTAAAVSCIILGWAILIYDMRWILRSKIHRATVTEADVNYIGSITIDRDLIDRAGFWPGEKVRVVSNSSATRLETYVIAGESGSGKICMNGAAALLIKSGEEVIIMGFELTSEPIERRVVLVDKSNKFLRYLSE